MPTESNVDSRFTGWAALPLAALLALLLAACPGGSGSKQRAPSAKCKAFGEQCEFLPGKLGSCVVRDDCRGEDCLVCQSQH